MVTRTDLTKSGRLVKQKNGIYHYQRGTVI